MKEINNIETNRPLNEWLYKERYNRNILVTLRCGEKCTFHTYKKNLNKELNDTSAERINQEFDPVEIWDVSNMKQPKLLWKRGKLLSKEEFMKEYERVFDNNVDWDNNESNKHYIIYNYYDKKLRIDTAGWFRSAISYCINEEKAQDFIKDYEQEIRKYLFGLEVE